MRAKCFHELFFNGLFGRLVLKSKSAGEREFLLQKDTNSLWSPKHLYLLLPLEKLNGICEGSLQINWCGINSCASAIKFLRRKFSLVTGDCDDNGTITSPHDTSSSEMECVGANKIHFANCVVDADNIKDRVVLAIHTGKIYCIIEIDSNLSAESPFYGNNEKSKESITFSDYFSKRCINCFIPPHAFSCPINLKFWYTLLNNLKFWSVMEFHWDILDSLCYGWSKVIIHTIFFSTSMRKVSCS